MPFLPQRNCLRYIDFYHATSHLIILVIYCENKNENPESTLIMDIELVFEVKSLVTL